PMAKRLRRISARRNQRYGSFVPATCDWRPSLSSAFSPSLGSATRGVTPVSSATSAGGPTLLDRVCLRTPLGDRGPTAGLIGRDLLLCQAGLALADLTLAVAELALPLGLVLLLLGGPVQLGLARGLFGLAALAHATSRAHPDQRPAPPEEGHGDRAADDEGQRRHLVGLVEHLEGNRLQG